PRSSLQGRLPPSLRQVAGEEQREERNAKRASGEQTAPAGLLRSEMDAPACSSGALLARFHQHFRVPFHVTHSSAAPRGGVPFSFADVAPGFSPARAALKGGATGQYPGRIALTRPECLTTCHCSAPKSSAKSFVFSAASNRGSPTFHALRVSQSDMTTQLNSGETSPS